MKIIITGIMLVIGIILLFGGFVVALMNESLKSVHYRNE